MFVPLYLFLVAGAFAADNAPLVPETSFAASPIPQVRPGIAPPAVTITDTEEIPDAFHFSSGVGIPDLYKLKATSCLQVALEAMYQFSRLPPTDIVTESMDDFESEDKECMLSFHFERSGNSPQQSFTNRIAQYAILAQIKYLTLPGIGGFRLTTSHVSWNNDHIADVMLYKDFSSAVRQDPAWHAAGASSSSSRRNHKRRVARALAELPPAMTHGKSVDVPQTHPKSLEKRATITYHAQTFTNAGTMLPWNLIISILGALLYIGDKSLAQSVPHTWQIQTRFKNPSRPDDRSLDTHAYSTYIPLTWPASELGSRIAPVQWGQAAKAFYVTGKELLRQGTFKEMKLFVKKRDVLMAIGYLTVQPLDFSTGEGGLPAGGGE